MCVRYKSGMTLWRGLSFLSAHTWSSGLHQPSKPQTLCLSPVPTTPKWLKALTSKGKRLLLIEAEWKARMFQRDPKRSYWGERVWLYSWWLLQLLSHIRPLEGTIVQRSWYSTIFSLSCWSEFWDKGWPSCQSRCLSRRRKWMDLPIFIVPPYNLRINHARLAMCTGNLARRIVLNYTHF